jgi:serine O-acetyltransferase
MTARRILILLRAAPLLPLYRLAPPSARAAIDRDVLRVLQPRLDLPLPDGFTTGQLAEALATKEFRSIFYERLRAGGGAARVLGLVLKRVVRGQVALELACDEIGPGLIVSHGFASIIAAERIGTDCLISQQVTVGWTDRGGPPVIGDRVRIGAGAIVLGPITVGDDAVIGAGAVVIEDVPAGVVVAGVPARVIPGAVDSYSALSASSRS